HALRSHGDSVRHSDCIKLQRYTARLLRSYLGFCRKIVQMYVARCHFRPCTRNADLRFCKTFVSQSDRPEHRPVRRFNIAFSVDMTLDAYIFFCFSLSRHTVDHLSFTFISFYARTPSVFCSCTTSSLSLPSVFLLIQVAISEPEILCQTLNSAAGTADSGEKWAADKAAARPEFCIPTSIEVAF